MFRKGPQYVYRTPNVPDISLVYLFIRIEELKMNRPIRSICFLLAAGLALGWAQAGPNGAQAATKNSAVQPAKANSAVVAQTQATSASRDVDKDFVQAIMVRNSEMMSMVKGEIAHGKDAKTKAMAQELLNQETANAAELKKLLGGGL